MSRRDFMKRATLASLALAGPDVKRVRENDLVDYIQKRLYFEDKSQYGNVTLFVAPELSEINRKNANVPEKTQCTFKRGDKVYTGFQIVYTEPESLENLDNGWIGEDFEMELFSPNGDSIRKTNGKTKDGKYLKWLGFTPEESGIYKAEVSLDNINLGELRFKVE